MWEICASTARNNLGNPPSNNVRNNSSLPAAGGTAGKEADRRGYRPFAPYPVTKAAPRPVGNIVELHIQAASPPRNREHGVVQTFPSSRQLSGTCREGPCSRGQPGPPLGAVGPATLQKVGASRPDGESKDRHPLGEETLGFGPAPRRLGLGAPTGSAALPPVGRIESATQLTRGDRSGHSCGTEAETEEAPAKLPRVDSSGAGAAPLQAGGLRGATRQAVEKASRRA